MICIRKELVPSLLISHDQVLMAAMSDGTVTQSELFLLITLLLRL